MARLSRRTLVGDVAAKPRRLVQDLAVDEFGELRGRKRSAAHTARQRGHDLTGWRRRTNDPFGRWNAFCATCNRVAVVCTETPSTLTDTYGSALTEDCA
jgi:hypothetical protein